MLSFYLQKLRQQLTKAGLMHFEEGAIENLNMDLGVEDQAELLPYDRKFEFPREKLKLGKSFRNLEFISIFSLLYALKSNYIFNYFTF